MRDGWAFRSLGDVCKVIGGGTPSKRNPAFYEGDIPWATVRDMRNEVLSRTEFRISRDAVKSSSTNIIPGHNVVIATRVGLGKVCLLEQDTAINQDLRGIIPKSDNLDVRFLFRWFQSVANMIEEEGTGATVKGVKLPFINSLQIPLPPLPEQNRIVAILDEAFAGIGTAVANTERNLANTRELFESYLNSVFSQWSEGWEMKRVGEVADHCLGKMLDKQKNKGVMRPYLRNVNVQWFEVNTSDLFQMRIEEHEESRYRVQQGDLLICEGGYPGRAAIWNKAESVFFQKALHRVRCKNQRYNRWLLYYLYFSDFNGELSKYFTGAGIQHFTGKALKELQVPWPPQSVLGDLLEGMEGMQEEVGRIKAIYQQKLAALAELKQSLLQKAFSGELTASRKAPDTILKAAEVA